MRDDLAIHNLRVPADAEADVCRCALCRPAGLIIPAQSPPFAARDASPAAVSPPFQAEGRRPVHRGPVQDESGVIDPTDARAAREIEGRAADPVGEFIVACGGRIP